MMQGTIVVLLFVCDNDDTKQQNVIMVYVALCLHLATVHNDAHVVIIGTFIYILIVSSNT